MRVASYLSALLLSGIVALAPAADLSAAPAGGGVKAGGTKSSTTKSSVKQGGAGSARGGSKSTLSSGRQAMMSRSMQARHAETARKNGENGGGHGYQSSYVHSPERFLTSNTPQRRNSAIAGHAFNSRSAEAEPGSDVTGMSTDSIESNIKKGYLVESYFNCQPGEGEQWDGFIDRCQTLEKAETAPLVAYLNTGCAVTKGEGAIFFLNRCAFVAPPLAIDP